MDDSEYTRRSDTGPFALTPEWVLDAEISDRAKVLYAVLGRYADQTARAWPSRRTLATRLRCSTDSIDRAARELIGVGALAVTMRLDPEKGQSTNLYTVLRVPPGVGADAEGGLGTGAEQNESHLEREGETQASPSSLAVQGDSGAAYDPLKLTKIEGRNLPFDALAKVTQADPVAEGGKLARALATIRPLAVRDCGLTPLHEPAWVEQRIAAEIERRAVMYAERWPNVELTPTALASNWSRVATPAPGRASLDGLQRAEEIAQRAIDHGREAP